MNLNKILIFFSLFILSLDKNSDMDKNWLKEYSYLDEKFKEEEQELKKQTRWRYQIRETNRRVKKTKIDEGAEE